VSEHPAGSGKAGTSGRLEMSIGEAIAHAREALLAGGIPADEAPGDAEVLARHLLGWDLARLIADRREAPPPAFLDRYATVIARRLTREPVSQIVGHREFWGLDFEVTRDVLTPRPETELVVQAVLDECARPEQFDSWPPIIVDVGTGSGCIAVALATELPDARFVASDASLPALNVARRNASRHRVSNRIAFRHTHHIPPESDVEIIVSNPPYVPEHDRASLPPEVREYEPAMALFGGEDGLDFYRLLLGSREDLSDNGRLIVEVGYDQAQRVIELARRRGFELVRTCRDLQGIERVVVVRTMPG